MVCLLREDLPLGDTEIQRAWGNCHKFRNLHFKKVEVYQGQSLFLRKMCPRQEDSSICLWTCLTLPGNMFKCSKKQLRQSQQIPAFTYRLEVSLHILQRVEQAKGVRTETTLLPHPWWLPSKVTPAVLMLCKHCHMPHCISATRFKQLLICTLYKPRKYSVLCGSLILCFYWHEEPCTACFYWRRGTALGCWVLLLGKKQTWWGAVRGVIEGWFSNLSSGTWFSSQETCLKLGYL